ncbi:MAG: TonB-dependent receptor plug domain-containing protein, partial [Janthinobacterium lividum]
MSVRRLAIFLLSGTAVSTPTFAQNTTSPDAAPHRLVTHAEGQPTVAADTETVRVNGRRQSPGGGLMVHETAPKQVDTVTRAFIEKQSPSNNAMQLIKLSPGANVATSDPYGLTNNNITVRGLNQDEMGWTLEGAPINDMGNYAIFINEWGDTENFQQVQLQSGSADLDSPTVAASAGIVNIYFRDPPHKTGGLVDYSYGMHEMNRIFMRGDTGDIGNSGMRAFLSYSYTDTKEWRGSGRTQRHHLDFKAIKDLPNDSRIELMAMYNRGFGGNPYRSPTMAQWRQYGNSFNFDSTYTTNDTNYWRLQTNPYENVLLSAPSTFNVGRRFAINLTPYFYYGYGGSRGGATLNESGSNGMP